jgi:hypothetical protein
MGPAVWTLSDEALLAGLGSGDPDAAAAFVHSFQRRVFGMTFSLGRTLLGGTRSTWGGPIPVNLTKVRQLRFEAASGHCTIVAYFNAHRPWNAG